MIKRGSAFFMLLSSVILMFHAMEVTGSLCLHALCLVWICLCCIQLPEDRFGLNGHCVSCFNLHLAIKVCPDAALSPFYAVNCED